MGGTSTWGSVLQNAVVKAERRLPSLLSTTLYQDPSTRMSTRPRTTAPAWKSTIPLMVFLRRRKYRIHACRRVQRLTIPNYPKSSTRDPHLPRPEGTVVAADHVQPKTPQQSHHYSLGPLHWTGPASQRSTNPRYASVPPKLGQRPSCPALRVVGQTQNKPCPLPTKRSSATTKNASQDG